MKKKKNDKLISMSAYAKKRGVSYTLIKRYVALKKLTKVDGLIDPELADKELDSKLDPAMRKTPSAKTNEGEENPTLDFNRAKARREASKADLAELDLLERQGKLISIELVKKEAEDLYRQYRDRMLNVVIRATKKLLGETNEFAFRKILKTEIEDAIRKIK